jgi:hypothetical protein
MPANSRDNFDPWQKKVTLEVNAKGVKEALRKSTILAFIE